MRHVLIVAAVAILLTSLGCEKKDSQGDSKAVGRTAYNKDIDGGKGPYAAQPDPKVLEDQGQISRKRQELLAAAVTSAPAATPTPASTPAPAPTPASGPESAPPASAPSAPTAP